MFATTLCVYTFNRLVDRSEAVWSLPAFVTGSGCVLLAVGVVLYTVTFALALGVPGAPAFGVALRPGLWVAVCPSLFLFTPPVVAIVGVGTLVSGVRTRTLGAPESDESRCRLLLY